MSLVEVNYHRHEDGDELTIPLYQELFHLSIDIDPKLFQLSYNDRPVDLPILFVHAVLELGHARVQRRVHLQETTGTQLFLGACDLLVPNFEYQNAHKYAVLELVLVLRDEVDHLILEIDDVSTVLGDQLLLIEVEDGLDLELHLGVGVGRRGFIRHVSLLFSN